MATTSDLRVCQSCWGNRPVGSHNCMGVWFSEIERRLVVCHCTCVEMYLKWDALRVKAYADAYPPTEKHSDLTTIDHGHDMGERWLSDPFGEE